MRSLLRMPCSAEQWQYIAFCCNTECGYGELLDEPRGVCFEGALCPVCGESAYEDPHDSSTFRFRIYKCRLRRVYTWWKPWTWFNTRLEMGEEVAKLTQPPQQAEPIASPSGDEFERAIARVQDALEHTIRPQLVKLPQHLPPDIDVDTRDELVDDVTDAVSDLDVVVGHLQDAGRHYRQQYRDERHLT